MYHEFLNERKVAAFQQIILRGRVHKVLSERVNTL